jgi:pimeloyl-ACP methyl ester carboxylesterase
VPSLEEAAWRRLITSNVTVRLVDPGDGDVCIVQAGTGGTPIVFVSGLGESAMTWAPILPKLAATNAVLAYDRPGLGESPPSTKERTVGRMVAELSDLLRLLELPPAVLIGHSLGGVVVEEVAFHHHDQVTGLVLIDPVAVSMLQLRALVMAQRAAIALPLVLSRIGVWSFLSKLNARSEAGRVTSDPGTKDALTAAIQGARLHRSSLLAARSELTGLIASVGDLQDRTIRCPMTVLSSGASGIGKRSRAMWTSQQAATAARSQDGRHEVVPGAGHYIHRARPDVVIDAIRDVLRRIG